MLYELRSCCFLQSTPTLAVYLCAGWMQGTPIVLHWLLEHRNQAPGFLEELAGPLWIIGCFGTRDNFPHATPAEVAAISQLMTAAMKYQHAFCFEWGPRSNAALESCIPFIAIYQMSVLGSLHRMSRGVTAQLNRAPLMQSLVHNAGVEYAALALIAGSCKYMQEQQQLEQPAMRGRHGSSSNSRSASGPMASFAQLVVPSDHELVAAALGKPVVAAYADSARSRSASAVNLYGFINSGTSALLGSGRQGEESRAECQLLVVVRLLLVVTPLLLLLQPHGKVLQQQLLIVLLLLVA